MILDILLLLFPGRCFPYDPVPAPVPTPTPAPVTFNCSKCTKSFTRQLNLQQHEQKYCKYRTVEGRQSHRVKPLKIRRPHVIDDAVDVVDESRMIDCEHSKIILGRHSLSGHVRDYEMIPNEVIVNANTWLDEEVGCVEALLEKFDASYVKGRLLLLAWFVKREIVNNEMKVVRREKIYISSYSCEHITDKKSWYLRHVEGICKNLDIFHNLDSDLEFDGVDRLLIKLNIVTRNLDAQSAFKLSPELIKRRAVINVNSEEACFKFAILSLLHYHDIATNRNYVNSYKPWDNELNFNDMDMNNINIRKDLPKFEKINQIKVNVHLWEGRLKGCIYNSNMVAERTVNLLLVVNSEGKRHYCGIPKLTRLYYQELKTSHSKLMCERCCQEFWSKEMLDEHYQYCSRGKLQKELMPKSKLYSFYSDEKELSPLKVVYADMECFIKDDVHMPAAVACYEVLHTHLKERQKDININSWVGDSSVIDFLSYLESVVHKQYKEDYTLTRQKIIMSKSQKDEFYSCTACPQCKKSFTESNQKVKDHCHITGQFRSPLCFKCNCKKQLRRRVLPVIFHNFKNYDAHMIIKHGLASMKGWKLGVIAQSKEKFMTLTAQIPVGKTKEDRTVYFTVKFLDSYQFLSSSLSKLVSNLDSLPITQQLKSKYPQLKDEVLKRKGVFPYSYFNSLDRLNEKCLPPKEAFHDDLNNEECSEEDYRHAQIAWNQFQCESFKDYMLSYLHLDVFLLADVFEKFRQVCLQQDELDPVHFISLPSLSFMSAFKMTKETIHLLQDINMYQMFERGIRGGLTFVNCHKSTTGIHEVENERVHLAYIDQNNLYGHSLCQPLPHSDFTWVEDVTPFSDPNFILNIDDEGEWGYYLEVDLRYPSKIHNKTEEFPLAPHSGVVTADMLSPYMIEMFQTLSENGGRKGKFKSSRKLLLTQFDKHNYHVHYRILKFYLEMGLELMKVHRVICFRQKRWLKPYIDFNSQKRAEATNAFEKDYYKLKNNALFGKCMEDVRKRIDYKLVTELEKYKKLVMSPLFYCRDVINDDILGVKMLKVDVLLDKPIYAGQAVLDYSKLEMYQLFYKTLSQCPTIKKIRLLGGDTDSFFLEIRTDMNTTRDDVFKSLSRFMDTSNYPSSHPLFSNKNKAKLGCFKDEACGSEIEEMILLRPKMYSMKIKGKSNGIKRAKGISKSIVANYSHDDYRDVFQSTSVSSVNMSIIQSKSHTVVTNTFKKRSLSAWEDKRVWVNKNESLPHGNVNSPVPPPKRRRICIPPSGDVE